MRHEAKKTQAACNPMWPRLQPYVIPPATLYACATRPTRPMYFSL